jgi:hypothetical protein
VTDHTITLRLHCDYTAITLRLCSCAIFRTLCLSLSLSPSLSLSLFIHTPHNALSAGAIFNTLFALAPVPSDRLDVAFDQTHFYKGANNAALGSIIDSRSRVKALYFHCFHDQRRPQFMANPFKYTRRNASFPFQ